MSNRYVCCFCGQTIEPKGFDVGSLLYTTNYDAPQESQRQQDLFCHAACLDERVHPSMRQYLLPRALGSDEPLKPDDIAKLPAFLREGAGRTNG